ncbi:MAG TPA: amidohydrolase [Longimicrobiales bacterium]|nr:amidohydrolase [Longimicrobiales bacterium]
MYTADSARPQAQAVAVRGERIVFVGSNREAAALRGDGTRVIDMAGKTVLPGLIDAHGHLGDLGTFLRSVDLFGTRSYEEVIERVARRAAQLPAGSWVIGRGWDQNDWPDTRFPTHERLSAAVPAHPVLLERVDGHAVLANARALRLAGITRTTPDTAGGRIVRDARRNPTGVFIDNAMSLVERVVPEETPAEQLEGAQLAMRELNRLGLTSVHDAGTKCPTLRLYEQLARSGELTVRNYAMIDGEVDECLKEMVALGPRLNVDGHHLMDVRAIKLSADGALGSRGARLIAPYADDPNQSGLELIPPQRIRDVAVRALQRGFQLNVHAIGDGANRTVLDAFESALGTVPKADHRFRIEHAQVLHADDIKRFAQLGVVPAMQAVHQTSDMYWAETRLGPARIKGAYAWRSLLDTGVIIAGGSDFPVESPNPLYSFKAAVSRQDAKGWPPGGWYSEQRMTRQEALQHLTIWPAYASFREHLVGSITTGKLADLVVFSRDIMTIPVEEILDARVELTIVGGKIVYETAPARTP